MHVAQSTLRTAQPLSPAAVVRALVVADDGAYDAIEAAGWSPVAAAGAWRLARYDSWDAAAHEPARALLNVLQRVEHPLAADAIAAIERGLEAGAGHAGVAAGAAGAAAGAGAAEQERVGA